jgi:hypothetical protein
MNNTPLEKDECIAFANWLNLKGLKFTHIANETGFRDPKTAMIVQSQKKRLGMSKGFPDYIILTPKGVVFVEMKRVKGSTMKPGQSEWIDAINEVKGAQAKICYGFEQAKEFVEHFL